MKINRREAIGAVAVSHLTVCTALAEDSCQGGKKVPEILTSVEELNDAELKKLLADQWVADQMVNQPASWHGAVLECGGLPCPSLTAELVCKGTAALLSKQSTFAGSGSLFRKISLCVEYLLRSQSKDGFIDLPTTNFNSPPDTAFAVMGLANAGKLAQKYDAPELLSLVKPFLLRAGDGLVAGGIHTANHRWIVSAALAQINDLFPNERYVRRIDQWLSEGIDIDEEGQYSERSTAIYNACVNHALVVIADKLSRPELLEPVRRNLDAMSFLLHGDEEVVTEISERQDRNQRGTLARYWFALRYLSVYDGNGRYAAMLKPHEPGNASLPLLMEYPDLNKQLPEPEGLPTDFQKYYPLTHVTRIRRGPTSATILHKGNNRLMSVRQGKIVVEAVRFAAAFFGKGQFEPANYRGVEGGWLCKQDLAGSYFQPVTNDRFLPIHRDNWSEALQQRKKTQRCELTLEARILEREHGFRVEFCAHGTDSVPVAIELNLREGGTLNGVDPAPDAHDARILSKGFAEYSIGEDRLTIGPGRAEHQYTQLRGADPKLPGLGVYLTGFTPFKHTITLAFS